MTTVATPTGRVWRQEVKFVVYAVLIVTVENVYVYRRHIYVCRSCNSSITKWCVLVLRSNIVVK